MTAPLVIIVNIGGMPVSATLPLETIDVLRQALATPAPSASVSPFLTAAEAADLLRCRKRRIYELVADARLTRQGDGRRLLVRRAEVERLAAGELTRC